MHCIALVGQALEICRTRVKASVEELTMHTLSSLSAVKICRFADLQICLDSNGVEWLALLCFVLSNHDHHDHHDHHHYPTAAPFSFSIPTFMSSHHNAWRSGSSSQLKLAPVRA